MKPKFPTWIKTAFASLFCLAAFSAQAELKINDISLTVYSSQSDVLLSEQNDWFEIYVSFDQNVAVTGGTNPYADITLNFRLGGNNSRTATLAAMQDDTMVFIYTPQSNDNAVGLTFADNAPVKVGTSGAIIHEAGVPGNRLTTLGGGIFSQFIDTTIRPTFETANQDTGSRMYDIAVSPPLALSGINLIRGSATPYALTIARESLGNSVNIPLAAHIESGSSVVSISQTTGVIAPGSDYFNFYLNGLTVGTAVIKISISLPGLGDHDILIPITVENGVNDRIMEYFLFNYQPIPSEFLEGTSATLQVRLGSKPTAPVTFNLTQTVSSGSAGAIVIPATLTFNTGIDVMTFTAHFRDGPATLTFGLTDPPGVTNGYSTSYCTLQAVNVPPTILDLADREVAIGENAEFGVFYTDPGINFDDPYSIRWSFNNGTSWPRTGQTVNYVFGAPGNYVGLVEVTDKDGGVARSTFRITVTVGYLLRLEAPLNYRGLLNLGVGTFEYTDPSSEIWDPIGGNRFGNDFSRAGIGVRAWPNNESSGTHYDTAFPRSYLFTWVDETQSALGAGSVIMPGSIQDVVINLNEESATVRHLFSQEWPPMAGIDGVGDADGDGLPDVWEAFWFKESQATSEDIGAVACTIPLDQYGPSGNNADEFLPAAGSMIVPNPDNTNWLVNVYAYPIPVGHIGMGWKGYAPDPNGGNPFSNLIQCRGIPEDRGDGVFRQYYCPPLTGSHSPARNNNPLTNPTVSDTTGTGLPDAWEYYFWQAILYEVNTNNMRRFDPTFSDYGPAIDTILAQDPVDRLYSDFRIDAGKPLIGHFTKQALLDMFDPSIVGVKHINLDPDNDGLTNFEEYILGTNPLHWDTSRDGMPDGWKVAMGLHPLDDGRASVLNGPAGNPDGDTFAKGSFDGPYGDHAIVYLDALYDQTYWNGKAAYPFNPNLAWQENPPNGPAFTNLDEFRVAEYYVISVGITGSVGPDEWMAFTTHPRDNDTDFDGMPDGWELYIGSCPMPRPGFNHAWPEIYLGMAIRPNDWDYDSLTTLQEFQNMTLGGPIARSLNVVEPMGPIDAPEEGVYGVGLRRTFPLPPDWDWTNKSRPTDPWNQDTDGDGLPDRLEWRESSDINGDGSSLVNLDPTMVTTALDHLPDGWKYVMGLQDTNNVFSLTEPNYTFGDPDGDGLPNYMEYLAGANYGWRYDKRYHWDDPLYFMPDEVLAEGSYGTPNWIDPMHKHFRAYNNADFFRPFPAPVVLETGFQLLRSFEADLTYGTLNTLLFSDNTYAGIVQRCMFVRQDPRFLTEPLARMQALVDYEYVVRDLYFSYGLQPLSWDPSISAVPPGSMPAAVLYYFLDWQQTGFFATMHPRSMDSDTDGMDDYWEAYHALNPIYGGDRAISDSDTQPTTMRGSITVNLAISDIDGGLVGPFSRAKPTPTAAIVGYKSYPWTPGGASSTAQAVTITPSSPIPQTATVYAWMPDANTYGEPRYMNLAIPYDLNINPALSGCPWGDIDLDGLSSREESFNLFAADLYSHTDPSPMWLTDPSYQNTATSPNGATYFTGPGSHVNNYYFAGANMDAIWWWPYLLNGSYGAAPTYLYDYEVNEGYDTDDDNIPDRDELQSPGMYGYSDPLDFDSPRTRKALYLPGDSAARTRNPYHHDKWALTSFTIEMWFRAEQPAGRGEQTLIERPVATPITAPEGATPWVVRRNFRIFLNNQGRLSFEMDNEALATFTAEISDSHRIIAPNQWYHVAIVMDSKNNLFTCYLNGDQTKTLLCDIKPNTGYFAGSIIQEPGNPGNGGTTTTVSYSQISPAPIVVGAVDRHPLAIIGSGWEPELDLFFKGWVDEIRIWDNVRTKSEIQNDMMRRIDKERVALVNDVRSAWDIEYAASAIPTDQFPPRILYHYSFDSLPDVVPAHGRNPMALIPNSDTDPLPNGYADAFLSRPPKTDYPGVTWWVDSPVRSRVYSADYTYIHWIQNTAAHLRQFPPRDMQTITPVWAADGVTCLGYAFRNTLDWLDPYTIGLVINPIGGGVDVPLANIPNKANPYGFFYKTAPTFGGEINPMTFGGTIGLNSRYEDIPVATDMLPLINAVVDIDIEMWDGRGRGSDYGSLSSVGDGIPDWWKIANSIDPFDPLAAYYDPDEDGLDNWAEYMAGTNPYSATSSGNGISDYFGRDDNGSLTYGQLYTAGDGIPTLWKYLNFVEPNFFGTEYLYRYIADEDPDNDGWTNWEEYMAGTHPMNPSQYPIPKKQFKFGYNGVQPLFAPLYIDSFSERTTGPLFNGGADGHMLGGDGITEWGRQLGDDGFTTRLSQVVPVSYLFFGNVVPGSATIEIYYDDPISGQIVIITAAFAQLNPQEDRVEITLPSGINVYGYLQLESGGLIFPSATLNGSIYRISYLHGWAFPFGVGDEWLITEAGTHVRGGYNQFFAYFDLNSNGQYDIDEPAGLSLYRPTWVSWDSVYSELAMKEEVFGYPRFGWPNSQNASPLSVTVTINDGFTSLPPMQINKPRNYFHEGDLIANGILGLDFGATTARTFGYSVLDGTTVIESGSLFFDLGSNATRRQMKGKYPTQSVPVFGNNIEFEWEMDYRNQGAAIKIVGVNDGVTYYDGIVPLPEMHGKPTDLNYYYTARPLMENGRTFINLTPGLYEYTITEHVRSTAINKKTFRERFQVDTGCDIDDLGRDIYSIEGVIDYKGRAETAQANNVLLHTFNGMETSVAGLIPGTATVLPGTVVFNVVDSLGNILISLNDTGAKGQLYAGAASTNAPSPIVFMGGYVTYDNSGDFVKNQYQVTFLNSLPAGTRLMVAHKYFLKNIIVEAFKLADNATDCLALSGQPVAHVVMDRKGPYIIKGLKPGKYAVRAFLDSNRNGILDSWESSGLGIPANMTGPVHNTRYDPIELPGPVHEQTAGNKKGINIEIFDKDTDNDLIPDAWEWQHFTSLGRSGWDEMQPDLPIWMEYADGELDSDPNFVDTDDDGLSDAFELRLTKSDSHEKDTSGSGVEDLECFLTFQDLRDPNAKEVYKTRKIDFDTDGEIFINTPHVPMVRGSEFRYILKYKESLTDEEWQVVDVKPVRAPNIARGSLPPGVLKMKPKPGKIIDWEKGFFKVDVEIRFLDHQEHYIDRRFNKINFQADE